MQSKTDDTPLVRLTDNAYASKIDDTPLLRLTDNAYAK